MVEIEIKNVVKLFTLLLLSEKEQSGYEIIKEVAKRMDKKASPGQIYPFLKELKKYHYVETKGRGKRDKQVYYLTKEGKKFISRLSNKFEDIFEIAIKPKLSTCAHCGCEVYKGGHKQTIGRKRLSFCCVACAKSYASNAK